jgi:hypothetical protein
MKTLPLEFVKGKFTLRQIKRDGNIAIYAQLRNDGGALSSYEVIKVSSHNGYEIAGVKIDAAETYPGNEKWGTDGFSYPNLNLAEKRFSKMSDQQKSK